MRRGVHVILCVYCFLMLSFINYLSIIYLFSVDTIIDWLTPLFCHVLVRGGDPILTLIMYICFVHVSFWGTCRCMYVVFFVPLPPHTVNMGFRFRNPWSISVVLVIVVLVNAV